MHRKHTYTHACMRACEAANELPRFMARLREAEFLGTGVDLTMLRKYRQYGKRAAGVAYVLEQLSDESLPKAAADLRAHAKAIVLKLRQKGVGPSMSCRLIVQTALQTT